MPLNVCPRCGASVAGHAICPICGYGRDVTSRYSPAAVFGFLLLLGVVLGAFVALLYHVEFGASPFAGHFHLPGVSVGLD